MRTGCSGSVITITEQSASRWENGSRRSRSRISCRQTQDESRWMTKNAKMKKALNTRGRVNAQDSVFHAFHLLLLHDCGANSSYLCLCRKKKSRFSHTWLKWKRQDGQSSLLELPLFFNSRLANCSYLQLMCSFSFSKQGNRKYVPTHTHTHRVGLRGSWLGMQQI